MTVKSAITVAVAILPSIFAPIAAGSGDEAISSAIDPTVEPYPSSIALTPTAEPDTATRQQQAPLQIEEVIVTSTKREKSVRQLPITINAVTGENLERIGARDIKDYITQVPGITLSDNSSGEAGGRSITIRGVGPGDSSGSAGNAGNQTVGQFIGDVPMTDPYSNFVTPDLDPYDLKLVEILKGPQGTTFGASALNGAIRYVPNEPGLNQWGARGFSDYASVRDGGSGFNYGGVVNLPIGDRLALRAVGVEQNSPGVYDNLRRDDKDADTRSKWSGRGQLRWEPTDQLRVNLLYLKQQAHQDDVLAADNGDGRLENNRQPGPSVIETGFDLASLDARYAFDDFGTLVLQASHQHKNSLLDLDPGITGFIGVQSLRAYGNFQTRGSTYEVRLVSPNGNDWNWIGGLALMRYSADAYATLYLAGTEDLSSLEGLPGLIITDQGLAAAKTTVEPQAKETSAYGELSRKFGERWELTLGARFYDTAFTGERQIVTAVTGTANAAQIDQGDTGLSPKVSLVFKPANNVLTYFTISRGFQFGGANAPAPLSLPGSNPVTGVPVPVEFKSSSIWNRELGIRTDWLDRTLHLDLTLFDLDWTDAQFVQQGGGVLNSSYIDNVGKVNSRGVEGSLVYLTPIRGLSLNLSASYIEAKTARDYDPGDGEIVASGTTMPATPHVQIATALAYEHAWGPWAVASSLMHSHWGPAFSDIQHDATIYDFDMFNATLAVSRHDWSGMPSLTLGLSNITDERTVMNYSAGGSTSGPSWIYSRPQTISLRLALEFD